MTGLRNLYQQQAMGNRTSSTGDATSPSTCGVGMQQVMGSGATGHVPIPEPCRAVLLVPHPRGEARASLRRGWPWSHEARGDSGAFSCRVTGLVPRGTWQHWSPLQASGVHGASGHMVTPEPFPGRWRALCHWTRGDTEALF
jgi:hypothetical protein